MVANDDENMKDDVYDHRDFDDESSNTTKAVPRYH